MDFFDNWTLNESEILSLTDLSSPSIASDPTQGLWSWPDQSTTRGLPYDYFVSEGGGRGSSSSSRKSSEDRDTGSSADDRPASGEERNLEAGKQGRPPAVEKESTYARTQACITNWMPFLERCTDLSPQRRRIQNRNAQRNFRQRQENERRRLEEKLKIAERQCSKLTKTCSELDSVVNTLKDRLKRLESENTVLRTSVYSMPWRKGLT